MPLTFGGGAGAGMGAGLDLPDLGLRSGICRKSAIQAFPVQDQLSTCTLVLLCPVHYQVQASVVDVVQMLKIDMQFS